MLIKIIQKTYSINKFLVKKETTVVLVMEKDIMEFFKLFLEKKVYQTIV